MRFFASFSCFGDAKIQAVNPAPRPSRTLRLKCRDRLSRGLFVDGTARRVGEPAVPSYGRASGRTNGGRAGHEWWHSVRGGKAN